MLTPLDIENREFKRKFGGYDRDDVEDFMSLILNDYEKLYKENISYKDKIEALTEVVNHFKAQEETLNSAIVSAQKAADSIIKNANESADLILKEAKLKASDIVREANEDIAKLKEKYQAIKQEMENYKIRMSAIINAQLNILKDIDDNSISHALTGTPRKDDENVSGEEQRL